MEKVGNFSPRTMGYVLRGLEDQGATILRLRDKEFGTLYRYDPDCKFEERYRLSKTDGPDAQRQHETKEAPLVQSYAGEGRGYAVSVGGMSYPLTNSHSGGLRAPAHRDIRWSGALSTLRTGPCAKSGSPAPWPVTGGVVKVRSMTPSNNYKTRSSTTPFLTQMIWSSNDRFLSHSRSQ